ncbi:uncharacterized protein LOC141913179 [Tubulanus polymorphus]|uniref:uncharacterized protein LOC141913179 n=1 Tax=Tubulanus polymorphus TaxID=672921 RepID=UPI003DA3C591
MPYCVAGNCNENAHAGGINFHTFPSKNAKLRRLWIKACGREESWKPGKDARICGLHFTDDCFVIPPAVAKSLAYKPDRVRLKPDMIPTIFKRRSDSVAANSISSTSSPVELTTRLNDSQRSQRSKSYERRCQKKIVNDLLRTHRKSPSLENQSKCEDESVGIKTESPELESSEMEVSLSTEFSYTQETQALNDTGVKLELKSEVDPSYSTESSFTQGTQGINDTEVKLELKSEVDPSYSMESSFTQGTQITKMFYASRSERDHLETTCISEEPVMDIETQFQEFDCQTLQKLQKHLDYYKEVTTILETMITNKKLSIQKLPKEPTPDLVTLLGLKDTI